MNDVWFCPNCHSVNRQRDARCYKCLAALMIRIERRASARDREIRAALDALVFGIAGASSFPTEAE